MIRKILCTLILSSLLTTSAFADGIDSFTKLLLHNNGVDGSTTFLDSEITPKTVTTNGNAQIDTAQFVFGGASGLFDGAGDYLTLASSTDWAMGTGDFTIDLRVRFNSVSNMWFVGVTNINHFDLEMRDANTLSTYLEGVRYDFAWTPATNTWYHVALTRSGTNLRAFVNGTQIGSTLSSSDNITTGTMSIGAQDSSPSGTYLDGWIDELRISKGIARWTANFTPPTAQYSLPTSNAPNFFLAFD